MQNLEIIKNAFKNASLKSQFNNRNLYWELNNNTLSLGDESSITTIAWIRNNSDDEAIYDLDELFYSSFIEDLKSNTSWTYMQDERNSFIHEWKSDSGDYLRIQMADESIHCILLYSGQY